VVIAREGADALTLEGVRGEWQRAHAAVLGNCKKALAGGSAPAAKPDRAAAGSPGRASPPRARGAKRSEK
jgi:hypothetical protein